MNTKRMLSASVLAACTWIGMPAGAAAEVMIGKLKNVQGNVEILKRGQSEWQKAADGAAIRPGDKISAGMQGRAKLEYPNSVIDIEPLTQFVVGRTMEDSEKFQTELFLQIGKVVSEVNPMSGRENRFTVTTPAGVCGIRGSKQEVGHFPQTGTEMRMIEGQGYMGTVKPENLPAPVQAVLGVAPASAAPATPEQAVQEFNQWIQEADRAAEGGGPAENAGLLDEKTLDFVYSASAGQSVEVRDGRDPGAVVDASQGLAREAVPDITPASISDKEREATQVTAEPVDQPVAVSNRAEQSVQADEVRAVTTTAVSTSTATTLRFPDRPGQ